jgi:hypothetical protein
MESRFSSHNQTEAISELVERSNEKLNTAAVDSADRAFNLSCTLGLLPTLLIVMLSFLLTRGSWAAAAIITLLMVIAVLGMANLAAYISRANTVKRVYEIEVWPEIGVFIGELNLPIEDFNKFVLNNLPEGAPLRDFIHSPQVQGSQAQDELKYDEESQNVS